MNAWRIWCLALGRKEGRSDREADRIAIIRTLILAFYMVTNCFIIYGVVRGHIFPVDRGLAPVGCTVNQ